MRTTQRLCVKQVASRREEYSCSQWPSVTTARGRLLRESASRQCLARLRNSFSKLLLARLRNTAVVAHAPAFAPQVHTHKHDIDSTQLRSSTASPHVTSGARPVNATFIQCHWQKIVLCSRPPELAWPNVKRLTPRPPCSTFQTGRTVERRRNAAAAPLQEDLLRASDQVVWSSAHVAGG